MVGSSPCVGSVNSDPLGYGYALARAPTYAPEPKLSDSRLGAFES
jgi:hypothetical protein